jgi:hypothetical protein
MSESLPIGARKITSSLRCTRCYAAEDSENKRLDSPASPEWDRLVGNAVPFLAYAAMIYYVVAFAPDQTPLRDRYFIEKLVGLGVDDGVPINSVLFSVFNLMGIYPVVFASLMLPAARSSNKVWAMKQLLSSCT